MTCWTPATFAVSIVVCADARRGYRPPGMYLQYNIGAVPLVEVEKASSRANKADGDIFLAQKHTRLCLDFKILDGFTLRLSKVPYVDLRGLDIVYDLLRTRCNGCIDLTLG